MSDETWMRCSRRSCKHVYEYAEAAWKKERELVWRQICPVCGEIGWYEATPKEIAKRKAQPALDYSI